MAEGDLKSTALTPEARLRTANILKKNLVSHVFGWSEGSSIFRLGWIPGLGGCDWNFISFSVCFGFILRKILFKEVTLQVGIA